MRYPADMIIEIEKEINANVEQGISVIHSIETAYGIAGKYGFCGLDPLLEELVRACYKSKIGPEACVLIDQEVSASVERGESKVSAIMNAIECCLEHNFAWTRIMHYYAEEIYYNRAYYYNNADTVANRIE